MLGHRRLACQPPWSACSRGHTLLSMWTGDRDMQGGSGVAKGEHIGGAELSARDETEPRAQQECVTPMSNNPAL